MDRRPRLVLLTLLLVAVPAAATGVPSAAVSVTDSPTDPIEPGDDGTVDRRTVGSSSDATEPVPGDGVSATFVNENGTPARLELGTGDVTSGYATPGPDMSASVATSDGELEAGYGMFVYQYKLERADNDSHRQQLVGEALDYAERRLESLRAREAAAIRSYQNGSASTRDLLSELARIDAQATVLRNELDEIKPYSSNELRIGNLQRSLQALEGPIRERIAQGLDGESSDVLVHVAATQNGLVLEMIDNDEYVRSSVRLDHFSPDDARGTIDNTQRMLDLYPDTFPIDTINGRYRVDPTNEDVVRVEFQIPQGVVQVYLDRGTELQYRERQRLPLDRLRTETVATNSDNGVEVTVNQTTEGNPILINVTSTRTNESIDGVVRIDGQRVGQTGEDGELWTVGARGTYTVTVLTFRETVNVTIPASPATVDSGTDASNANDQGTTSDESRITPDGDDPARAAADGAILYH